MGKTAVNRRNLILLEAATLFASKGYPATGMRELAERVGIEPASLYSHFTSKEAILWELALNCAHDFQSSVAPLAQQKASPAERLHQMIVEHVEVTLRNRTSARIFTDEWRQLGADKRNEYAQMRAEYERLFRTVIEEGLATGSFNGFDAKFVTLTVLSALNFTATWYRPDGNLTPHQIGDQLARLLLHGLTR